MEFAPGTALPPPSPERVAWFESTYGVALPPDFLDTLLRANGAVPLTNLFSQGGRERLVERLLCLLDHPKQHPELGWYDITVVMTQVGERLVSDEDLVGMNVIPFAALFAGDLVCLDYREGARQPVVAVWDHELSEEFQPRLERVADSFAEFSRMLRRG